MTPEMVHWFDGYQHQIPNMTLDEFRNCVNFKILTDWTPNMFYEWEIEKFYMAS